MKITKVKLNNILANHKKWIFDKTGGKCADLHGADLQGAYLQCAYLQGANLQRADLQGADLHGADLQGADLHGADLQGAYLQGAYLHGANLQRADLQGAYLHGADLQGVDLQSANLQGAYLQSTKIGYENNLTILKTIDTKGNIYAWKYIQNGKSPYQDVEYKINKTYTEKNYDSNEENECGKGLNIATLIWCYLDSFGKDNIEFLKVKHKAKDIIAIPYTSDGKYRVKKMTIIKKYSLKEVKKILNIKEVKNEIQHSKS